MASYALKSSDLQTINDYIRSNPNCYADEICKKFGYEPKAMSGALRRLRINGKITVVGRNGIRCRWGPL